MRFGSVRWAVMDEDPDALALATSGESLGQLVGLGLAEAGVIHRSSALLLVVQGVTVHGESDARDVVIDVQADVVDSDLAIVRLPRGVGKLTEADQAALALEIVRVALDHVAQAHHWAPGVVDAGIHFAVERGFVLRWDGPWKSAPGRRHGARVRYWSDATGHSRVIVEVREHGAEVVTRASLAPAVSLEVSQVKKIASALAWVGAEVVALTFPAWGGHPQQQIRVHIRDDLDSDTVADPTWMTVATRSEGLPHVRLAVADDGERSWLSTGGIVIDSPRLATLTRAQEQRVCEAFTLVVTAMSASLEEGAIWLEPTGVSQLGIQITLTDRDLVLTGTRIHRQSDLQTELLTGVAVDATEAAALGDDDLLTRMGALIHDHLMAVGRRRKLGPLPRTVDDSWRQRLGSPVILTPADAPFARRRADAWILLVGSFDPPDQDVVWWIGVGSELSQALEGMPGFDPGEVDKVLVHAFVGPSDPADADGIRQRHLQLCFEPDEVRLPPTALRCLVAARIIDALVMSCGDWGVTLPEAGIANVRRQFGAGEAPFPTPRSA